jgi:hypothetical protein
MARKLGIQYPGAIYHVTHRGDHGEEIFGDDRSSRRGQSMRMHYFDRRYDDLIDRPPFRPL